MRANETVLRNVLQGERQFVIPLYQRPYSWRRPQLERLWADIRELIDSPDTDNHFMGSLVLAQNEPIAASGIQSWLVVDGQQRLTSLSILLCAIRDRIRRADSVFSRKINVQYLTNEFTGSLDAYKLLPTQADRSVWMALVDSRVDIEVGDRIEDAYRYFSGQLERIPEEAAFGGKSVVESLKDVERVVTTRLTFVEITAQSGDNVYRIFESLNNTGLKLTQADLLRNYIFMRLPERSERVYRDHWLPLQELLDEENLVELIWLDLILKGNRSANKHSIYEAQRGFLESLHTEEAIERWVAALLCKAMIFRRVLVPSEENDPVVREALDRLHRWKAKVLHPVALRVLLAHDDGKMSSQETANALRAVESYLVRQLIVGTGRAGSNVLLADLIKSLGSETPYSERIIEILAGQRRRFPADDQVREAMINQPFYWRGKEWQKSFILRSLDESFGRVEVVDYEKSKLTIEHVLPQQMTNEWRSSLDADLDEFDSADEAHEFIVHTVGNLTLSAYNGSLSNKPFSDKKKILAQSGLSMNLAIASSESWGIAEIRKRSAELAERAISIWPGPVGSSGASEVKRLAAVKAVLSEIPRGSWTNILSLAQAAGTHRRSIAKLLSEAEVPNAHRVLRSDGSIPPHSADPEAQLRLLMSEGVKIVGGRRASRAQHLGYVDLVHASEDYGDDG